MNRYLAFLLVLLLAVTAAPVLADHEPGHPAPQPEPAPAPVPQPTPVPDDGSGGSGGSYADTPPAQVDPGFIDQTMTAPLQQFWASLVRWLTGLLWGVSSLLLLLAELIYTLQDWLLTAGARLLTTLGENLLIVAITVLGLTFLVSGIVLTMRHVLYTDIVTPKRVLIVLVLVMLFYSAAGPIFLELERARAGLGGEIYDGLFTAEYSDIPYYFPWQERNMAVDVSAWSVDATYEDAHTGTQILPLAFDDHYFPARNAEWSSYDATRRSDLFDLTGTGFLRMLFNMLILSPLAVLEAVLHVSLTLAVFLILVGLLGSLIISGWAPFTGTSLQLFFLLIGLFIGSLIVSALQAMLMVVLFSVVTSEEGLIVFAAGLLVLAIEFAFVRRVIGMISHALSLALGQATPGEQTKNVHFERMLKDLLRPPFRRVA